MGDRANVVIQQGDGKRIYLYSHWGGYELPESLAVGLDKGRGRWDDESYLARIIFREMGAGQEGETGFGISTYPPDNEHPFLVVDTKAKAVRVEKDDRHGYARNSSWDGLAIGDVVPFDAFVKKFGAGVEQEP